jgi:HMG box factor
MSTAVYYSNGNMSMDETHKNTLPSLAQIMPPVTQQYQDFPPSNQQSPKLSYQPNAKFPDTKLVSNQQVDLYSHNPSGSSTTTPVANFSQPQPIVQLPSEKCICKPSASKIPRPRNAFILFRQKYHQSVLDEGNVIRTNPEVSRELGRRWRALSPEEKNHWNNLANEEKKNHAKKYPGYRYTPRRNGKAKNCPHCRQDSLRQLQLHNQQIMQYQQDQYQQYMQLHQQPAINGQNGIGPVGQVGQVAQVGQNGIGQVGQNGISQVGHQVMANQPLPQEVTQYPNQHFVISSTPFPPQGQHNGQYQYPFTYANDNFSNNQDKLSPLSSGQVPQGVNNQTLPAGSGVQPSMSLNSHGDYVTSNLNSTSNSQFLVGGYDQPQPQVPHQRFNSLPTPVNSNNYGFDGYGQQ